MKAWSTYEKNNNQNEFPSYIYTHIYLSMTNSEHIPSLTDL